MKNSITHPKHRIIFTHHKPSTAEEGEGEGVKKKKKKKQTLEIFLMNYQYAAVTREINLK